jgi:hypothetical protein
MQVVMEIQQWVHNALRQNVSGNNNVGVGYFAMFGNSIGSNNVGVGFGALYGNQTGYSNVAIGSYAFYGNGASKNCVAIGDSALMNHNNPDPHFNKWICYKSSKYCSRI